jgi:SPX domain protein involved in polyphosphate accumulation
MKFAQTLKKQRLAEWSRAYIGYSALKKQIVGCTELHCT